MQLITLIDKNRSDIINIPYEFMFLLIKVSLTDSRLNGDRPHSREKNNSEESVFIMTTEDVVDTIRIISNFSVLHHEGKYNG